MADAADVAQYHMEQMEAQVGVGHRGKPWESLQAVGQCYNCDERLEPEQRFCDKDCRDDWAKRRAARMRR